MSRPPGRGFRYPPLLPPLVPGGSSSPRLPRERLDTGQVAASQAPLAEPRRRVLGGSLPEDPSGLCKVDASRAPRPVGSRLQVVARGGARVGRRQRISRRQSSLAGRGEMVRAASSRSGAGAGRSRGRVEGPSDAREGVSASRDAAASLRPGAGSRGFPEAVWSSRCLGPGDFRSAAVEVLSVGGL